MSALPQKRTSPSAPSLRPLCAKSRQTALQQKGVLRAPQDRRFGVPLFHWFAILRIEGCRTGLLGDKTKNKRIAFLQEYARPPVGGEVTPATA
jgi:hypothetical protein